VYGLTANAFESDRQSCLDAGMNGFIAKPVTRAKLGEVLSAVSKPARQDSYDQRAALVEEFGVEAYGGLVASLIEDGHSLIGEVEASEDPTTRTRAMHSLKGMARTLGFCALGDSAAAAELAAKASAQIDLTPLKQALREIEHSMPSSSAALEPLASSG
ncbi:MAG: Hpt domain-containing protein, partial [Devosia sp.]